jgi:hypothetical protein
MIEKGEFAYKMYVNEYLNYIDTILQDKTGFNIIALTPPPANVLVSILPLFSCSKELLRKQTENFSRFIFWIENIMVIATFFLYELLILAPKAYFKMLADLFKV